MDLVFVSNYINHHQIPVSKALLQLCEADGGNYRFIQTEPMEQERIDMGWAKSVTELSFVHMYWEEKEQCQKWIDEADVVIFGGVEEESYIQTRLMQNKPIWRYSERLYKTGRYRFVSPRGLRKKFHDHTRHNGRRMYLLCSGAYVAGDFNLVLSYLGKKRKYGYFPAFRPYDTEELMAGKSSAAEGFVSLVWAARMIDWKHPEMPIHVAKELKDRGCSFRLIMIGGGTMEQEIHQLAESLGVTDVVDFKGFLSPEETRTHMEKADIYLTTSDQKEGWGAVINEAMNSGCAVIANRAMGAAPYLIENTNNGFLYRGQRTETVADLAELLIRDPEKRKSMAQAAYDTVSELWNQQVAAERLYACMKAELQGETLPVYEKGPLSPA